MKMHYKRSFKWLKELREDWQYENGWWMVDEEEKPEYAQQFKWKISDHLDQYYRRNLLERNLDFDDHKDARYYGELNRELEQEQREIESKQKSIRDSLLLERMSSLDSSTSSSLSPSSSLEEHDTTSNSLSRQARALVKRSASFREWKDDDIVEEDGEEDGKRGNHQQQEEEEGTMNSGHASPQGSQRFASPFSEEWSAQGDVPVDNPDSPFSLMFVEERQPFLEN
jgi:hypothetical protein